MNPIQPTKDQVTIDQLQQVELIQELTPEEKEVYRKNILACQADLPTLQQGIWVIYKDGKLAGSSYNIDDLFHLTTDIYYTRKVGHLP